MADYSRDQLMQALRSADAAGDTAAAQAIARRLDGMRSRPDFSNVRAGPIASPPDTSPAALTGISDEQMQPEGLLSHLARGGKDFVRAAGHNAMGFLHGTADFVGEGAALASEGAAKVAPMSFGGLAQTVRKSADSDQAATRAWEQQYQQDVPDSPASIAGAATGQILPWTVGAPAKLMTAVGTRGPGLAAKVAGGARQGAVIGAASPVTEDGSYLEQKAGQVGVGALAGTVGQVVGDALVASGTKAANAITPELRALYTKAQSMGIQLTPAQLTDSGFVRRLSLMLDNLPMSGAPARRAAQQSAGNQQIAKAIGEQSPSVDQATMAKAHDRLGQEFDSVFSNGMTYDRQFLRDVAQIKKDATMLDDNAMRVANRFADRITRQANKGKLSGKTLQSIDQEVRKWATGGGDRQQVATALRESLHNAFERQAPAAVSDAWLTARRQYATMKTLEPLVSRNPEGGIPLQQLQGAINSTQRGRTARARGRDGSLGDLATIGQRIKPPNSSGTSENAQAASVGAGALTNLPMTLATLGLGGLGSRALSSKTASQVMLRPNAGATRKAVGGAVKGQLLTPAAVRAKREKDKKGQN